MRHPSRPPSQRQLRVGEQLRHVISEALQRGHFRDSLLMEEAHNITVSEVRASPDLRKAKAYVMSLGGQHINELLDALNSESDLFQKEINRNLNMKFTPRISFVTDQSYEEAQKIENILKTLPHGKDEEEDTKENGQA